MLAVALAGCSAVAPASRLDAFETRAETIHSELLGRLPGDLEQSARTASRAWIDESEWLVPRERQTAHWTTESVVDISDAAAVAAAGAIAAHLADAKWTAESTVDPDGSAYEVYRLADDGGEWIVEVARSDGAPFRVMVQSPVTVRGADDG
jgi:hypothetical protein